MRPHAHAIKALLAAALAVYVSPSAANAWTPATQVAIGESAATVSPPDLARQIERHHKEFRRGLLAPFTGTAQSAHEKNANGSGRLDQSVTQISERAIKAISVHRPFSEVVFELGRLAHFVADANNPLNSSNSDPDESVYFTDYLRYVDSARERYALVFYADGRDVQEADDLEKLIARSLERGRDLYPLIALEYERIGRVDGVELFDDRSTAFGVGSLAVSHAISDIAAVLRYVWLEAGGGDHRKIGLTRPYSTPP